MNQPLPHCSNTVSVCPAGRAGRFDTVSGWVVWMVVGFVFLSVLTEAARAETPGNFFRASGSLPADVQRVLVLPLTCDPQRLDLVNGCESLEAVLQAEVAKTRKFEVIKVAPTTLRSRTGRGAWNADEPLSPKFFETLREAFGCDAILFCRLTEFKAYTPLSVGWRLRLVDARSQQTIWATDEVFDAAQSPVQAGVRKSGRKPGLSGYLQKPEDWLALHSPRRFGEFALASVLATLPER